MKVLLIDDQEKILEATKKLVDWKKLEVSKVYTANNAMTARRILSENDIDIVLSDIEMPGENGIELQGWISESYPDVACIFLTSHADFKYAQTAIRNGAFDYILQPANFSEIERVVGKCIEYLKEKRKILKKSNRFDETRGGILKQHVFAMFHQKEQFSAMERWMEDSKTKEENWWYLPCMIQSFSGGLEEKEERILDEIRKIGFLEKEISCMAACLNVHEAGVIFYGKNIMPDISVIKEKLWFACQNISEEYNLPLNLYIGQYAQQDLPKIIGKLVEFQKNHIVKRNQVYIVEDSIPKEIRKPDAAVWGRWLLRHDTVLLKNQILNLLRFAQQEQYLTISYMRMLIHCFLQACSIACYEQKMKLEDLFDENYTYEQMLGSWASVEELNRGVDKVLRKYVELSADEGEENISSPKERVQEILVYLDEHMDQMLSRREAAKYVFLNEDYFSRIFRKETGMGYKEYVLKQKVEYAKKLLKNTDMPIVIVASKVGYENYTNFTQMFRKMTGVTPTEYRKRE